MRRVSALIIVLTLFITAYVFAVDIADIMPSLKAATKSVNSTLSEIDKDLSAAAKALSGMDLKSDAARKTLNDLIKSRSYIINCSILDSNGIKITVEPQEYKNFEGADRSELPYVMFILKNKKPAMSDVYHSAEGIHAIGIGYPIISTKGELLGAVRILIRYEDFLKPLIENRSCKIWVMQKNGLIVYDQDPEEVGKNIFSDPMFSQFGDLISFSKTVASSRNGAGSYSFYANGINSKKLVDKVAAWSTAGLYGTEWRIVAMEISSPVEQASKADSSK